MQFYLPSFLTADLNGEFQFSLVFILSKISEYREKQFELLSKAQKDCVTDYLNFQIVNGLVDLNQTSQIEKSISEYWTK